MSSQSLTKQGGRPYHQENFSFLIKGKPIDVYTRKGTKRICGYVGCGTILSRYTPWTLCSPHKRTLDEEVELFKKEEELRKKEWETIIRKKYGSGWETKPKAIKGKKKKKTDERRDVETLIF